MNMEPTTFAMPMQNEREVVRSAGRQAISSFLESHNCFSVLRASGKVVVFDVNIPIQLAFYALVEHGMYSYNNMNCTVIVVVQMIQWIHSS